VAPTLALYVGLAATWIPLGYLVASTSNRSGSAGFGTNVTWQAYGLTQLRAIALYLKLSVWPDPLVFDYGTGLAHSLSEVASSAFIRCRPVGGHAGRTPALASPRVRRCVVLGHSRPHDQRDAGGHPDHGRASDCTCRLAGVVALVVVGAFRVGETPV